MRLFMDVVRTLFFHPMDVGGETCFSFLSGFDGGGWVRGLSGGPATRLGSAVYLSTIAFL